MLNYLPRNCHAIGVFTQIVTLSFKLEFKCSRRAIMHHELFIVISVVLITIPHLGSCIGISSKLDFGDSPSSPKLISTPTQYKVLAPRYKQIKKEEPKRDGDFGEIGVVCVSGGCNKTESPSGESRDSIQTDVVVHVQTSVDLSKNKSTFVDDIPDVPVIVGVAGAKLDHTVDEEARRSYVVTDLDKINPSLGSTFTNPSTESRVINPSIGSTFASVFSPQISRNPPLYMPGIRSDSIFVQKSDAAEPRVDINIKTLPPVSVSMSEDGRHFKDIRYRVANGIELRVPYFEPSYNKHYFGESSPPQLLWYPKTTGVLNPVEFKNVQKSTWNPSFWSTRFSPSYNHYDSESDRNCPCKNHQGTGLQWHPNRRTITNEDPGSQINDKLAQLN